MSTSTGSEKRSNNQIIPLVSGSLVKQNFHKGLSTLSTPQLIHYSKINYLHKVKNVLKVRLFFGILATFLFIAGTSISYTHAIEETISSVAAGSHKTGNTTAFTERTNSCNTEAENISITVAANPVSWIKSQHTAHYMLAGLAANMPFRKLTTVLYNAPAPWIALSGPGIIFPFHYFW